MSNIAYMTFLVVAPYRHLGLEPGDRLYVRFGARRFTVTSPMGGCRFIPANYGAVLGAMTGGAVIQVAGLFMENSTPVRWGAAERL